MNKITAEDVKLDKSVLDYVSTQPAPMCVMDILENKDITIAIFILKHGVMMPMHDHPGMHGLLKVKYIWNIIQSEMIIITTLNIVSV